MFRQFQHAECGKSNNKDSPHDGTNYKGSKVKLPGQSTTRYCSEWREDTLFNLPNSVNCETCIVQDGVKATLVRWLTNKNHNVRTDAIKEALNLCNRNGIWNRNDIWGTNPTYIGNEDIKKKKLKSVALKLTGGKKGIVDAELKKSVLSCVNYSYAKAKAAANCPGLCPTWKPFVADVIKVSYTEEWLAHYIVMKMILKPCLEMTGNISSTIPECKLTPKFGVVRAPPAADAAAAAAGASNTILKQNARHNLGDTPERTFLNTIVNIGEKLSEVHKLLYGRRGDNHCQLPGGWKSWEYPRN